MEYADDGRECLFVADESVSQQADEDEGMGVFRDAAWILDGGLQPADAMARD